MHLGTSSSEKELVMRVARVLFTLLSVHLVLIALWLLWVQHARARLFGQEQGISGLRLLVWMFFLSYGGMSGLRAVTRTRTSARQHALMCWVLLFTFHACYLVRILSAPLWPRDQEPQAWSALDMLEQLMTDVICCGFLMWQERLNDRDHVALCDQLLQEPLLTIQCSLVNSPARPQSSSTMDLNTDTILRPFSRMDTLMSNHTLLLLYIFPPASAPYNPDKLQSSLRALVEHDYPILMGELDVDPNTGVINVKQSKAQQELGGAKHIRFETNPCNAMTTEEAMQKRSMELMPTPRSKTEVICFKGTLLADGGLAIGVNTSHAVFDGEAIFTFMRVWGQHYSGVKKEDRLVVNHDRHLLRGEGVPPKLAHPEYQIAHIETPTDLSSLPATTDHFFHFTRAMMKNIKDMATGDSMNEGRKPSYVSTVDSITALFTVLISLARGHGQDVRVSTAVNGRKRLEPQLPAHYAGNVVFNTMSTYSTSDLYDDSDKAVPVPASTIGTLARRVRGSILKYDPSYLRDALNFLDEQSNMSDVHFGCNFLYGPDLMFTSWLHLGMYDASFDGTHPCYACIPTIPYCDGVVVLTEAPQPADGIDVGVLLECSAMDRLKELFSQVSYLYE
ncbi:hypothetical protein PsorP6_012191 [Peronosclerospora sorghi]|uniref:Uncharacterized protein n=1 Tax=Peronosclerospora sorghi TaxID=230839 RepID=A0ACC0WKD0_9STRA|nr:hypothetical protein PsorP6_012191 [Peronosclerospora sorghi]